MADKVKPAVGPLGVEARVVGGGEVPALAPITRYHRHASLDLGAETQQFHIYFYKNGTEVK